MAVTGNEVRVKRIGRARAFHLSGRKTMAYLMVLPALLIILGVVFYPIADAFWLSLHDIDLRYPQQGEPFIGLKNYTDAFADPDLWDAFRFTSLFAVISVSIELVFGMFVALLLNRKFAGRGIVQALVLIPWSLTTVIVARMWNLIYNSEYGILNALLKGVGLIQQNKLWTADKDLTFWAVVIADVWKATPFMALILLAGLQVIPEDLYEAAKMDGATGWQSYWHITLPSLRATMVVALIFRTIDATRIFDMVFVLTNGNYGTSSLNLFTYNKLFKELNFGSGSALAIITFVYIALIAMLYLYVGRQRDKKA